METSQTQKSPKRKRKSKPKHKGKALTNTEKAILKHADVILTGHILCVDPSSGSHSSLPGYAIYKQGELVESGVVQVDLGERIHSRLFEINRTFREEFEVPDLLVLEWIPPMSFKSGLHTKAVASLHKGIGAIMAAIPTPLLEVHPRTWQKFNTASYVKTDENDAIGIGFAVIQISKQLLAREQAGETD